MTHRKWRNGLNGQSCPFLHFLWVTLNSHPVEFWMVDKIKFNYWFTLLKKSTEPGMHLILESMFLCGCRRHRSLGKWRLSLSLFLSRRLYGFDCSYLRIKGLATFGRHLTGCNPVLSQTFASGHYQKQARTKFYNNDDDSTILSEWAMHLGNTLFLLMAIMADTVVRNLNQ